MDRLSSLIQHFRIEAHVLETGAGDASEEAGDQTAANLFIVRRGLLQVPGGSEPDPVGEAPILVFFPHGAPPGFAIREDEGVAEYVSASVHTGGDANPVARALPDVVQVPLGAAQSMKTVADILLEEALSPRCGRQAVVDRLCEVVVVRLLRHQIEAGKAEAGLIAGLAHPSLSPAIVAIHDHPARQWRLEDLASIAAMSRTHFANTFRKVLGVTPGQYLSDWRLSLARMEIVKGTPLKAVVKRVGFSSSAALSRAFKRRYGISPRQDLNKSA